MPKYCLLITLLVPNFLVSNTTFKWTPIERALISLLRSLIVNWQYCHRKTGLNWPNCNFRIICVFYFHNFFYGYFVYNAKMITLSCEFFWRLPYFFLWNFVYNANDMITLSCEFFGGFHNFFYGEIKKNDFILFFSSTMYPGTWIWRKIKIPCTRVHGTWDFFCLVFQFSWFFPIN